LGHTTKLSKSEAKGISKKRASVDDEKIGFYSKKAEKSDRINIRTLTNKSSVKNQNET
jgi:hypothetical protein